MFVNTKEQNDIEEFVEVDNRNLLIEALAGAGKTTTLINLIKLLPQDKSITFLAFNKHIQMELKSKLPENVWCYTSHGLGRGGIVRKYKDAELDEFKVDKIITKKAYKWDLSDFKEEEELEQYLKSLKKLTSLCKSTLTTQKNKIPELAEKYDIPIYTNSNLNRVMSILEASINDKKTYDFDDMIFLPAVDPKIWLFPQDYVLLDEAQDMNRAQQEIVKKILKKDRKTGKLTGRLISVGDKNQCQPKGTKILMYDGTEKNIENVVVGDRVVSYDRKHKGAFLGYYKNHRWGADSMKNNAPIVDEVFNRYIDDSVIVIESGGRKSKYTSNHRCFVRFRPDKIKAHVLYLMQKNDSFRIGMSPLWTKNKENSVSSRARGERTDKFWILNIYDNKHDAYVDEQYYSLQYCIPQMRFYDNSTGLFTQKTINKFHNRFDKTQMLSNAIKLLDKFNRYYKYPIWEKNGKNYLSKSHLFEIKACNIVGDYMQMIHFDENNIHIRTHGNNKYSDYQLKVKYLNIDKLTHEKYVDFVYSLKIKKYEAYVADGMLTHNSIYGFSGSDEYSFEWFKKFPNTVTYPLTTTFRCSEMVVLEANKIVPDLNAMKSAKRGDVREGNVVLEAKSGDFVLCRKTLPLVKLFFQYLSKHKKAVIKGSDIGSSLIEMVKRKRNIDILKSSLKAELKEFAKKIQSTGVLNIKEHSGYTALEDKIMVLLFIAEMSKNMGELKGKINSIFTDKIEGIVLSTVHKIKGLEADTVFIIRPDLLPMKTKKSWEYQQEKNLQYVAITRAKNTLIYDYEWNDEKISLENIKNNLL